MKKTGVFSVVLKKRTTSCAETENSSARDYNEYHYSGTELIRYTLIALALILPTAWLFYNSLIFAIFLLPFVPYYLVSKRRKLQEDRKWQLNLQFRDCLSCISSALEAGYSIENALSEAYKDLGLTYSETDPIMTELNYIIRRVATNVSVEDAFTDLAERSGVEDIRSFADIFAGAKRSGGNLIKIIRYTSGIIHTRVEVALELKTVMASKKMESDIMKIIPFAIILYLRLFSPEMIAPLYGNMFGAVFMSVVLVVWLVLAGISDRLVKITL